MHDAGVGEVLVEREALAKRVVELAEEVSRDYEGRDLLLVGVLKGAVFFLSDLMRHLDRECEVDFMAVSSYGSSTDSSGVVRILKDLDASIEGRRRADRRGHRGLGSHALVSDAHAARRATRRRSRSAHCSPSPSGGRWTCRFATWASRSRTAS